MYSYAGKRSLEDFAIFFAEAYQEAQHESVPERPKELSFPEKLIKTIASNNKAIIVAASLIVGVLLVAVVAKVLTKKPVKVSKDVKEPINDVPAPESNEQAPTPVDGNEVQQTPGLETSGIEKVE